MNRTARTVLAVTLSIGAAATLAAILLATGENNVALKLWLGLLLGGALMELATIPGDEEEAEHPFSLASSFHLAAAMLMPAGWAALIAGGATALGETARRKAFIRVVFNAGVAVTATLAASGVFHGLYQGRIEDSGWNVYVPVAAMLVVYVVITVVAIEAISTAVTGNRWDVLSWIRRPELVSYLMECCVAVVLAVLVTSAPQVLAFAVILLGAVFLSMKRHRALRGETRQTLKALASAVDARDPYTAEHSERVGHLAARFAEAIGMSTKAVSDARWAGRMHDLGKVVVDNSILHKDGALDEREWELMRSHPNVSADLLQPLSLTRDLAPAIRYHHERPDGLGYYGLTLENTPIEAAIITLADSYDAMTTNRPYRAGMTHEAACNRIEECLGVQFHPELGRAFVQMLRGEAVDPVVLPKTSPLKRRWFWQRRVELPTPTEDGWQPTSAIDAERSLSKTHSLIP